MTLTITKGSMSKIVKFSRLNFKTNFTQVKYY